MFSNSFIRLSNRSASFPKTLSSPPSPTLLQYVNFSTRKPKIPLTKQIINEMEKRLKDPSTSEESRFFLRENLKFAQKVTRKRKPAKIYREEMRERHESIRQVLLDEYNERMETFLRSKRYDKTEKYYEDMKRAENKPNLQTFKIMFRCALQREDSEERAESLLEDMESWGFSPDLEIEKIRLKISAKKGAESLLRQWDLLQSQFTPDVDAYAILLQQLGLLKEFTRMEEWYSHLREKELELNVNVANAIIEVYAREGDLPLMRQWLKEFESKGISFNGRTFHLLGRGYQQSGVQDVFSEWIRDGTLSKMSEKSVTWTTSAVDAILSLWKSFEMPKEISEANQKELERRRTLLRDISPLPSRELTPQETEHFQSFLHLLTSSLKE